MFTRIADIASRAVHSFVTVLRFPIYLSVTQRVSVSCERENRQAATPDICLSSFSFTLHSLNAIIRHPLNS